MPKEDEERKVKNQRCGQGEVTPLGGAQHAGLSTFPPLLPCWLALRTLISHYTWREESRSYGHPDFRFPPSLCSFCHPPEAVSLRIQGTPFPPLLSLLFFEDEEVRSCRACSQESEDLSSLFFSLDNLPWLFLAWGSKWMTPSSFA